MTPDRQGLYPPAGQFESGPDHSPTPSKTKRTRSKSQFKGKFGEGHQKPTKAFLSSIHKTQRSKFINKPDTKLGGTMQAAYDTNANILTESEGQDWSP